MVAEDSSPGYDFPSFMQVIKAPVVGKAPSRTNLFRRINFLVVVVQSLSHVQLFETHVLAACQAPLSFIISWSLLKFMSIQSVMLTKHLILCHTLLLLPSIFPIRKSIRVFSNELALCIRGSKYCSFSFSISLSNEYSGLISFGMDWLDLLA